jgi:uncharacterized protein YpmS
MHDDELIPTKKGVFKWWAFGLLLAIITVCVFAVLSATGIIFQTEVERRTFERSYQKKAGDRQKISTYEAQLAEINSQLADPKLDPAIAKTLRAQRAALRVRLRAARNQQQR